MGICYDDGRAEVPANLPPYETWNAVKGYLNHYANYLYLDFLSKQSTDGRERAQARKELTICERKLKYWTTHPNWDKKAVLEGVEKLKRDWAAK
jgi:hypothetical protein